MGNTAIIDSSSYARSVTITAASSLTQSSVCPVQPGAGVEYNPNTHGASVYSTGASFAGFGVAYNANLSVGTQNFTFEFWVKPTANAVSGIGMVFHNYWFHVYRNNSGALIWGSINGGFYTSPNNTCPLNVWTHFAVSKTGGNIYYFANGTLLTSAADTRDFPLRTDMGIDMLRGGAADDCFIGFLGGFHLIIGTGLYTANFTPTASFSSHANTRLLFKCKDFDLYDSRAKTPLYMLGASARSATQSKFGGYSMYFPGTTADYMYCPNAVNTDLAMSTQEFTFELWAYPTGLANATRVLAQLGSPFFNIHINTSNQWVASINDVASLIDTSATVTLNQWYHVALVRRSGAYYLYVNGQEKATTTSQGSLDSTGSALYLGKFGAASQYPYQGYIDDLRITKSVARYTSNFSVPTLAHPKY